MISNTRSLVQDKMIVVKIVVFESVGKINIYVIALSLYDNIFEIFLSF